MIRIVEPEQRDYARVRLLDTLTEAHPEMRLSVSEINTISDLIALECLRAAESDEK